MTPGRAKTKSDSEKKRKWIERAGSAVDSRENGRHHNTNGRCLVTLAAGTQNFPYHPGVMNASANKIIDGKKANTQAFSRVSAVNFAPVPDKCE
jgi:hypothetical protein